MVEQTDWQWMVGPSQRTTMQAMGGVIWLETSGKTDWHPLLPDPEAVAPAVGARDYPSV